jgi:hypothetical protein
MAEELDKSIEVGVIAATLRSDAADSTQLLELLAEKLEGSLPELTKVVRKGGLFTKKRVQSISVQLGEYHYVIERQNGISARRSRVVRGIALKTEEFKVDEWIDALATELAKQAESNQRTRDALERFVIGR